MSRSKSISIDLPANATIAAVGNSITLGANGFGSTQGSVTSGSSTEHTITSNIPSGKIVVLSLSSTTGNPDNCVLTLRRVSGQSGPIVASYGGWYNPTKMRYYRTTDSSATYKIIVESGSGGYSGSYTINVKVVNAIVNSFSKKDSLESSAIDTSNTFIMSNAPEGLSQNQHKGEWGYYLQRSKVKGNANIFWEHQNHFTFDATFGILLWNREPNKKLTVTLNKRSFNDYNSAGNSLETAMLSIWEDWFNGVKKEDEYWDNFETTPLIIDENSAKWICLYTVPHDINELATFSGVMSISIKEQITGQLYTGDQLWCDTYIMTPGYEYQVIPNLPNARRASVTTNPDNTLRGSGNAPILTTTISSIPAITSNSPFEILLGGYDVPDLNLGEKVSLSDVDNAWNVTTLPNMQNFGTVYKITFNNFSSSSPVKGRFKLDIYTNFNGPASQWAGVYVAGYRASPNRQPIFKKLVYTGQEFIFDMDVPRGQAVTYYFVIGAMSAPPVHISFTN